MLRLDVSGLRIVDGVGEVIVGGRMRLGVDRVQRVRRRVRVGNWCGGVQELGVLHGGGQEASIGGCQKGAESDDLCGWNVAFVMKC